MTLQKHRRRLRNFLVDQSFQLRTGLTFLVVTLVLTGSFAALVYQEAREASQVTLLGLTEVDSAIAGLLAAEDSLLLGKLIAGVVLLSLLLTVASLVKTHRIAGPVFVIGRALRELAAGGWPPVRDLREKDEFRGLGQDLQALVRALRQHREELADQLEELAAATTQPELRLRLQQLAQAERPPAPAGPSAADPTPPADPTPTAPP